MSTELASPQVKDINGKILLGFGMGILQVRIWYTIPIPAHTIPVMVRVHTISVYLRVPLLSLLLVPSFDHSCSC